MTLSCSLGLNNGRLYLHEEVWMRNHKKGKFPDLLFPQLLLLQIAFVEASLRELMVSVQPERHSKNAYNCIDESHFCFKEFSWWYMITGPTKILGNDNSLRLKTHKLRPPLSNGAITASFIFSSFHLNMEEEPSSEMWVFACGNGLYQKFQSLVTPW